jgi:LysM repeat protein
VGSLKNGFVIAVMLAAGYGVYVMLNRSPGVTLSKAPYEAPWSATEIQSGNPGTTPPAVTVPTQISTENSQSPASGLPQVEIARATTDGSGHSDHLPIGTVGLGVVKTNELEQTQVENSTALGTFSQNRTAPGEEDSSTAEVAANATATSRAVTSPAAEEPVSVAHNAFAADWRVVEGHLAENRLADALFALSMWYGSAELTTGQKTQLIEMLDQLAGAVIYSREHTLQPPYQIQPGETLEQIAQSFDVPWQFLANVNGVYDLNQLVPGQEIKVVHGQFTAEVDLKRREVTLFLGRYYAGRFPIQIGQDPFPAPGHYEVVDKSQEGRLFVGLDGEVVPAGDSSNPYGIVSLGLSDNLVIHAAPSSGTQKGCIMVTAKDMTDLFTILSEGSKLAIVDKSSSNSGTAPMSSLGSTLEVSRSSLFSQ